MQLNQILTNIKAHIDRKPEFEAYQDYFDTIRLLGKEDKAKSYEHNLWLRQETTRECRASTDPKTVADFYNLTHKSYIYGAEKSFDDFMVAVEWQREPKAKFWVPRRNVLEGKHKIASRIQAFLDDPDALFLGFSMPPGTGKALADDTPILTAHGWKTHGELAVGDRVVSPNGRFVRVTNVFPKCEVDCEVRFNSGEKIVCHENHEWDVYDRKKNRTRLVETKEFFGNEEDFYIEKPQRVVGKTQKLPVAPYSLGVWLGDGENRHPRICLSREDEAVIVGMEQDGYALTNTWESECCYNFYSFKSLRKELQKAGMCYSMSRCEKRIPDCYYVADVTQRLELVAGLIDSDGCYIAPKNRYLFTTKEESLRDDFIRLAATLGWRCGVYKRKHAKDSTTWAVGFNADIEIPCRLPRKKNGSCDLRYHRHSVISATRIKPMQGNCIEVSGGMYLAGNTMIPTHNSTLIKFLLAYTYGKYPDSANMYCSYSDSIVKMMYDGVTSIITDGTEYRFNDLFPAAKAPLCSAEYYTITARKKGDFPTLGLISLGGSVTGRTRANKLLITDDLVKNKELARSPQRLETLYQDYLATITTRTIGDDVKQIMLGTIWSAHCPLSRMKEEHKGDPRYTFIMLPVRDEEGHSLFHYDHPDRYTDERIANLEATLDPVDFSCLYMQRGIEKEGLAFPSDALQYYNGVLPEGEPDNILFYADVAFGGGDSFSMPIAYVYGKDVFIHDVIFDRGDKSITMPRVVGKTLQHKIKFGQFEANSGGDFYCDEVNRLLREKHNYSTNIGSKRASSKMSKLSRIEQHAPAIKRFYFRDATCRDNDYKNFMEELTTFSFTSKNLHDDAPDALAGLSDKLYYGTTAHVEIGKRLW